MKKLLHVLVATALGITSLLARAEDPNALRAKYAELREPLRSNSFGRAIHINSTETNDVLTGDIYAVLDYPFKTVSESLKGPGDWCDIMLLPFNTKYCHANGAGDAVTLDVRIGRKFDQPVQDAYQIDFAYKAVAASADYLESRLTAATGPLGTRNYRIAISAVPLDNGKSFMHLSYSYGYGFAGRLAMQAYLSTAGASKVGFSSAGKTANGEPVLIGGMRGAIERNVMRYYLAIDSYLVSQSASPQQRVDKQISTWFNATERYARQLHEMDRAQYVSMKRAEYERAQTALN